MEKTVVINGVSYAVKALEAPLASDPSQMVVFVETSDATAVAGSVKDGEKFYVGGKLLVGTMPVNGAGGGEISTKDGVILIPEGHYSGGGSVKISATEMAKLIASNIRKGVTILGVEGGMDSTEGMKAQSKTATPTKSQQVIVPDNGYNCLTQVTVAAIPAQYIITTDATAAEDDLKLGESAYVNGKKIIGTHTDPVFALANGVLSIS